MGRAGKIALVPEHVDLELYAGDGASLRLVVTDASGAPIPLDGLVTAQIRASRTDPAIAASWAADLSEAANGVVLISLTGVQTAALVNGEDFSGFWDVEWDATDQEPVTLMQGKVTCALDVTHA